jgi:multidrug efflux system membrane fusion protein
VVKNGLAPGERVVVNGLRKIFFPGAPVNPMLVPMTNPEQAAPGGPVQPGT